MKVLDVFPKETQHLLHLRLVQLVEWRSWNAHVGGHIIMPVKFSEAHVYGTTTRRTDQLQTCHQA